MSKWKAFYLSSYRGLLLVLFVGNLFLNDWVTELMVLAFACAHFAFQLDPKRSQRDKVAQGVLMLGGIILGGAYLYLKYKIGSR